MMYSKTQLKAIELIEALVEKFGSGRWFVQPELPGVTLHTLKALVDKGYLEEMQRRMDEEPMKGYYKWMGYRMNAKSMTMRYYRVS